MKIIEKHALLYTHLSEEWKLINELQVCSLAKQEEELFLPNDSTPIMLDRNSEELRLIQKIRDEAHRFAITFNKEKRLKAQTKNILDSIPGI
jgi:excinuclease ABC subunit C